MSRPFTLSDAMVLIVSVALGLAAARSFRDFMDVRRTVDLSWRVDANSTTGLQVSTSDYMNRSTAGQFRPRIKGEFIYWARQVSFWPGPGLAALTLATLVLGLRRPRPHSAPRLTAGEAVAMAVVLAMTVSAVRLPQLLIDRASTGPIEWRWEDWWLELWFTVPEIAGFAVAVAWATLALSGGWRVERGWLDRLGIALGIGWIVMAVLDLAASWYHALPF